MFETSIQQEKKYIHKNRWNKRQPTLRHGIKFDGRVLNIVHIPAIFQKHAYKQPKIVSVYNIHAYGQTAQCEGYTESNGIDEKKKQM